MARISITDLDGLVEAIEIVQTLCAHADEGAHIHEVAARAGRAERWVRKEIRRRQLKAVARSALKVSRGI